MNNNRETLGRDLERAQERLDMAKGSLVVGDRDSALRFLTEAEDTVKGLLVENSVRDGSPLRFVWDDEGNLWENYPLII